MMFKLFVLILVGGVNAVPPVYYNKATWPTQAACEEFIKTPEGISSIQQLADVVHAQVSPDAVLKPYCSDKDPE